MTPAEKDQLVKRLQDGRKAARAQRPARLAALERRMDEAGRQYKGAAMRGDYAFMAEVRAELAAMGRERMRLKYGE